MPCVTYIVGLRDVPDEVLDALVAVARPQHIA